MSDEDSGASEVLDLSGYEELKKAFVNERCAPEILPYQGDLMEHMQAIVKRLESTLMSVRSKEEGVQEVVQQIFDTSSLSRVKYLVRGYLRSRLFKIEKFAILLLDSPEEFSKLSKEEKEYAQVYFQFLYQHMKSCVLDRLPESLNSIYKQTDCSENTDMMDMPDMDLHVFCKVENDCGDVILDPDEGTNLTFEKGDMYIVRYSLIKDWLLRGDVSLI